MHPYLTIGTTVIDLYYAFLKLGMGAGSLVAYVYLRRSLGGKRAALLVVFMIVSALFGAHLAHCIFHWERYRMEPLRLFDLWHGGHSFLGAPAFGAVVLLVLSACVPWIKFFVVADAFSLGMPLGLSIARVGCYLRGCCWGTPLAQDSVLYGWSFKLIEHRLTAVHPVQIYSSFANLLIFLILLALAKKQRSSGTLTGVFFLLYASARFVLEFFRGDTPRMASLYNLSVHQAICIVVGVGSCFFLLARWRTRRRPAMFFDPSS